MLKQAAYLYNNVQTLYTDLETSGIGYRKMYARNMKLYKGIDNTFQFKLLNGDQKLLNAVGQTLSVILLDAKNSELRGILTKTIEGSDNSLVSLTLTESELEGLDSGMYMYSAYLTDDTGKRTILYSDSQYGVSVPVQIISNSFPQVYPSIILDEFTETPSGKYTSAVDARPELNNKNNALHTAAIYSTEYTGTVNIEVTLNNESNQGWAILDTVNIVEPLHYVNFNGVFMFVRFRTVDDPSNTGTVDKILYRS